jgi:NadR type nicotinamide-nucleotide adenylyltransferase
VIKVVLTGPESTGKTELAQRLGQHYRAPVAAEFVRDFAARRDGKIEFGDHGAIARGQMSSEDRAIAIAGDVVILDTDLVSTVVYCEHYFGRVPEWIAAEARARAGQLYLLMEPDIPWQADGVRDRPERREEMHGLFRDRLREYGLRYIEIRGKGEERFQAAVDAIDAIVIAEP